jgi:predicted metal-dependent hydrolase
MMPYSAPRMATGQKRAMDSHAKDRLFQKGLEAFNSAHFYDAHEHWEEVWLQTQNPEKMFLQGLIQVAAAFHHYSRANCLGCLNLLQAGLTKLEQFPQEHYGLEVEPLRASVRVWLGVLKSGGTAENTKIPRIKTHGSGHTTI